MLVIILAFGINIVYSTCISNAWCNALNSKYTLHVQCRLYSMLFVLPFSAFLLFQLILLILCSSSSFKTELLSIGSVGAVSLNALQQAFSSTHTARRCNWWSGKTSTANRVKATKSGSKIPVMDAMLRYSIKELFINCWYSFVCNKLCFFKTLFMRTW